MFELLFGQDVNKAESGSHIGDISLSCGIDTEFTKVLVLLEG